MERHTKTLTIALVFALLYVVFRTVMTGLEARKALSLEIPRDMGMNEELLAKVDTLERDIARRSNYEVELVRDPLKLSAVMDIRDRGAAAKEFIEKHRRMRLSATIIAPNKKSAVIKYRSKSYVLGVGDTLSDHRVVRIDKKTAVLEHDGREIVLENRPAPTHEKRRGTSRDIEDIAL
jgi:type II secretory pathway component PulC